MIFKNFKSHPPSSKQIELIYGINPIEVLINYDPSRIITIFQVSKEAQKVNPKIQSICDLARKLQISMQNINLKTIDKWFVEPVNHQGIIAQITPTKFLVEEDLLDLIEEQKLKKTPSVFLVLDNIQDPRNLGACIRNAAAFGVTGVIISRNATCDLTPTVKKVASGASEIVPIAKVGNLANCLSKLQKAGIWVISLAASNAKNLSDLDLNMSLALVLGSEDQGVRRIIQKNSDFLAKIPMINNSIDSLNLSVATGICLYEVNRQRGFN